MQVETLRDEVVNALQQLAWDQWSQLGVSAAPPERRSEHAADPEALLLFTLEVGRTDPRLFDEVLDWLALNEPLVSVHRLRSLSSDPDRALLDSALDWVARIRRGRSTDAVARDLRPLFPGFATPTDDLDPAFAAHGFARTPLEPSGKSQPPRVTEPIAFAFRMRRLLGVGVRAEVMRALLTIRAPWLSGRVITGSAAFSQRNVREGLVQLQEAGVVDMRIVADDRHYSVGSAEWAALLRVDSLPLHYDWIPAYRALRRILRFLHTPELDSLSPYLRASQARTVVDEIDADLRYAGMPPVNYSAFGSDMWDRFAEIARAAIRSARAPTAA